MQRNCTVDVTDEDCMLDASDTEEVDEGSDSVCSYVLCSYVHVVS